MKGLFLVPLFFLFITCTQAQNHKLDSLRQLINITKSDTQKINLVNQLIYALCQINIDSSNAMAKENIEVAKKIKFKQGEADASRFLSANLARQGNYTLAEKYLKSAESICFSLKDSLRIAKIYASYGMMYGMQSKYDSSIQFYKKSMGISERHADMDALSSAYGNIAIDYQMQSNFPQAIIYQLKSLKIAEQQNDINGQAYTQMNLGNTYQNIGDTLRAEKALLKGIELAKSIGVKDVELYGYSNIGSLYADTKRWNESYKYTMQAAELAKVLGDAGIESASLSKAAIALSNMQKFTEAEALSKQAMAIADSSNQPFNIFQAYSAMGFILKNEEKYKDAIPFFEKSLRTLSSADMFDDNIEQAYFALSICYEKTGNYSKALTNFKTASQISDSIRSKDNIRKATELTLNSEFEKKQAIADALQAKKNAETELHQIILLSGLFITLVIAIGAWRRARHKQKANQLLQKQKEEIQSTLVQLKAAQAQLIQAEKMASLGELTAGIAHEIQNPLNFVKNFSEVSAELIDEIKEEIYLDNKENIIAIGNDLKNNLEKITHHTMRADAIVKGMLQHSRASSGETELTNINELAEEYLRLSYHGLRAKDKNFNTQMQANYDTTIDKINIVSQDIGRVLLNLFNNAFYSVAEMKLHKPEGYEPLVSVSTKKIKDIIEIRIKDNGEGIPQKKLDKIFQPFFTTKPTGQGTGLGLSLSYDIIKAHNGNIKVETKEGEGAEFIIELPDFL